MSPIFSAASAIDFVIQFVIQIKAIERFSEAPDENNLNRVP